MSTTTTIAHTLWQTVMDAMAGKIEIEPISEAEAAAWRLSGQTVDLLNVEPGGLVTANVGGWDD